MEDVSERLIAGVVIGVQKSATSWIHECLREHPDLDAKRSKDERYYYGGEIFQQKGLEWYYNLYKNNGNPKICISVDYIKDTTSPKTLWENNKRVKILVSLRNPMERVVSAYYWYLRQNDIESISLSEALEKAVADYSQGISSKYSDLIQRSLYSEDIQRYLNRFGSQQFRILLYEQIRENPTQVLEDVFRFFGVDPTFKPSSLTRQPKKNSYNATVNRIQKVLPKNKVIDKGFDFLNQYLVKMKKKKKTVEVDPIDQEVRNSLLSIFQEDSRNLKNLLTQNPQLLLTKQSGNVFDQTHGSFTL